MSVPFSFQMMLEQNWMIMTTVCTSTNSINGWLCCAGSKPLRGERPMPKVREVKWSMLQALKEVVLPVKDRFHACSCLMMMLADIVARFKTSRFDIKWMQEELYSLSYAMLIVHSKLHELVWWWCPVEVTWSCYSHSTTANSIDCPRSLNTSRSINPWRGCCECTFVGSATSTIALEN